MSNAAAHAAIFYRDVARNRRLWTIRDERGFPAPASSEGTRAQPFWSSLSRVRRIIQNVPAYSGFEPYELSWDDFAAKWVPGLTADGILVGVNWNGPQALGYDLTAEAVRSAVECQMGLL
jgi:hypothetical protein